MDASMAVDGPMGRGRWWSISPYHDLLASSVRRWEAIVSGSKQQAGGIGG
jgi:hypothetical protein